MNQPTGTIMDVEHIVILMQENRSFDHYFGTLKGVRGFGDRFPIPVAGQRNVWFQRNDSAGANPAVVSPFHLNTQQSFDIMRSTGRPHTWPNAQAAWNNGILDCWPTFKQTHAMGYYTEADIPFQFALANAFTICDAYHSSLQAGTNPNRVYAWSCGIDPFQQGPGQVIRQQRRPPGFRPGRRLRLDHLSRAPAGGRDQLAGLSGHGRQRRRQSAGRVQDRRAHLVRGGVGMLVRFQRARGAPAWLFAPLCRARRDRQRQQQRPGDGHANGLAVQCSSQRKNG